jgi:hypothetical protein
VFCLDSQPTSNAQQLYMYAGWVQPNNHNNKQQGRQLCSRLGTAGAGQPCQKQLVHCIQQGMPVRVIPSSCSTKHKCARVCGRGSWCCLMGFFSWLLPLLMIHLK